MHSLHGVTRSGEISNVREHYGTISVSRQQTEKSGRNGLPDVGLLGTGITKIYK